MVGFVCGGSEEHLLLGTEEMRHFWYQGLCWFDQAVPWQPLVLLAALKCASNTICLFICLCSFIIQLRPV